MVLRPGSRALLIKFAKFPAGFDSIVTDPSGGNPSQCPTPFAKLGWDFVSSVFTGLWCE